MKLTISTIDPRCLNDERGVPVCQVLTEEMAQEVVRITNAHQDLVASNNELRDQVRQLVAALKAARESIEHFTDDGTGFRESTATADIQDIDTALAAVGAA